MLQDIYHQDCQLRIIRINRIDQLRFSRPGRGISDAVVLRQPTFRVQIPVFGSKTQAVKLVVCPQNRPVKDYKAHLISF